MSLADDDPDVEEGMQHLRALEPSASDERLRALVKRDLTRHGRWMKRNSEGWRLVGFRLRIGAGPKARYANGARLWRSKRHAFLFHAIEWREELDCGTKSGRGWARGHRASLRGLPIPGEATAEKLLTDAASLGFKIVFDEKLPSPGVIDIVSVWVRKVPR